MFEPKRAMTPKEFSDALRSRFPFFRWEDYKPAEGYEHLYEKRATCFAYHGKERVGEAIQWEDGRAQVDISLQVCGSPEEVMAYLSQLQELLQSHQGADYPWIKTGGDQ